MLESIIHVCSLQLQHLQCLQLEGACNERTHQQYCIWVVFDSDSLNHSASQLCMYCQPACAGQASSVRRAAVSGSWWWRSLSVVCNYAPICSLRTRSFPSNKRPLTAASATFQPLVKSRHFTVCYVALFSRQLQIRLVLEKLITVSLT